METHDPTRKFGSGLWSDYDQGHGQDYDQGHGQGNGPNYGAGYRLKMKLAKAVHAASTRSVRHSQPVP